ncbi:MAG TPA: SapC family protein, partial [Caulobacteraceae bacterium]
RRYPFVLAQPDAVPGQPAPDRMLVGIDRAYEYIAENAAYPFFNEAGETSEYTQRCMQFCNDFEAQVRTTRSFIDMLKELDLFEQRSTTYTPQNQDGTPGGEPQLIAEYFGVSEAKLKALPKDKLAEMLDNGALQQIYAHLNSLFCWDRLMARHVERWNAENPPAANA